MERKIQADVILKPISFPDEVQIIYAELDARDLRTGRNFAMDELRSIDWCKDHLLVSIYDWPRFEKQLAAGETVPVARGPVDFDDVSEEKH